MAIVLGAGLVSQPSFIFGELSKGQDREEYYTLGAIIAIIGAIAGGIFPVLMAKCKEVPSGLFMAVGGAVSLCIGAVHRIVITNAEGSGHYGSHLIGLLILVSTMSMVGVLMKQMAVAATCPVLVTMVRSMEIVMALVVDICLSDKIHPEDIQFWYKVVGACTVTACVITMSVADRIHEGLVTCTRAVVGHDRDRSQYTVIGGLHQADEATSLLNQPRNLA